MADAFTTARSFTRTPAKPTTPAFTPTGTRKKEPWEPRWYSATPDDIGWYAGAILALFGVAIAQGIERGRAIRRSPTPAPNTP